MWLWVYWRRREYDLSSFDRHWDIIFGANADSQMASISTWPGSRDCLVAPCCWRGEFGTLNKHQFAWGVFLLLHFWCFGWYGVYTIRPRLKGVWHLHKTMNNIFASTSWSYLITGLDWWTGLIGLSLFISHDIQPLKCRKFVHSYCLIISCIYTSSSHCMLVVNVATSYYFV